MKLQSIIAIALLKFTTSHHLFGFAGKQQTEIASPDSYINLGQLQLQKHNEVLDYAGKHHKYYKKHHKKYYKKHHKKYYKKHHKVYKSIFPSRELYASESFLPASYFPTTYAEGASQVKASRLFARHFILPETFYSSGARIASPSAGIAVGTIKNKNQGAVFKE